jgi:uncharacterized protein YheU (UPF0270 family)
MGIGYLELLEESMIIPPEKLEPQTLLNILEEYISREGTDYGEVELSLAEKVKKLLPQVNNGDVLIIYDEVLDSIDLREAKDYSE